MLRITILEAMPAGEGGGDGDGPATFICPFTAFIRLVDIRRMMQLHHARRALATSAIVLRGVDG
ncbi:hypothetical protein ATO13_10856 [Stappia sp. 22II-S9-Z10]|nr:hypothetical protein ATO13_10856 [Stappia sp. 22II-S9-Z10]